MTSSRPCRPGCGWTGWPRCSAAGQRLALDRRSAGHLRKAGGTIGGVLATGAARPLRLRYGTPRDLLIGITVVRADGAVAKSGGKVVKNVAGYDIGKLFAGSRGTLGLITQATFRLHPVPAETAYVTAECAAAVDACQVIAVALESSRPARSRPSSTGQPAAIRSGSALPCRATRLASPPARSRWPGCSAMTRRHPCGQTAAMVGRRSRGAARRHGTPDRVLARRPRRDTGRDPRRGAGGRARSRRRRLGGGRRAATRRCPRSATPVPSPPSWPCCEPRSGTACPRTRVTICPNPASRGCPPGRARGDGADLRRSRGGVRPPRCQRPPRRPGAGARGA